eukprot:GHRR01018084.1.p3 GENE.GHRR01018084.1~~GHRR01018084.1.p3  ORF type:complete len:106 (-),score=28.39 GHRR01018084.1:170-487(-)
MATHMHLCSLLHRSLKKQDMGISMFVHSNVNMHTWDIMHSVIQPEQVAALVHIVIIHKLAASVQLCVVVEQLDFPRLQHVVQAQLITASKLIEQLQAAQGSNSSC